MSQRSLDEEQENCPLCRNSLRLIKVARAAEIANVSEKTVYRYIEEGSVYCAKIAGKTYRVCRSCLIRPYLGK